MKSKSFTIAHASLDGAVQTITPAIEYPYPQVYSPKGIEIYNGSGADLEYVVLSTTQEVAEFAAGSPAVYDYILLKSGATLYSTNFPNVLQFKIRKVSGTVSTDLRVDFFGYQFASFS